MRSLLTRRVFRRLVAEQPVVRHHHVHHVAIRPQINRNRSPAIRTRGQSRTLFGLFTTPRKDVQQGPGDPGMEKMLALDRRLHLVARLPPANELVHAVRIFIKDKIERRRPIEDFQAERLLQTVRTLEEHEQCREAQEFHKDKPGGEDWTLDVETLKLVLQALEQKRSQIYTKLHNKLAQTVWQALALRLDEKSLHSFEPKGYIQVLSMTGDADKACAVLEGCLDQTRAGANSWAVILAGLSKEHRTEQMLQLLRQVEKIGSKEDLHIQRVMAVHSARANDIDASKKWFTTNILKRQEGSELPSCFNLIPNISEVYQQLLQFCLRNNELEWGNALIQSVGREHADSANEETWRAIFLASAATGKSVDEIDQMVTVMIRRSQGTSTQSTKPSIHTLNGLIKFAISKNDPYTAERYFGLARKWQVVPNAETFILQTAYRLAANDLHGALASYSSLREVKVNNDEDWFIMNKLLQSLLSLPKPSHETIMGLIADLSDRKRLFDSKTVMALCRYHLGRDEYFEIVDLLETYAHQYSISQRIEIRDVLSDYALSPSCDTGRAWDTYMIFHQIFDVETRRDIRNRAMKIFFDRMRPDLGTHVFTRMQQHMRADSRPNAETYALAFEGISKSGDHEALEVIHNLLKLDTETEPNTRILNGLMLAYMSCSLPQRSLHFWDQISISPEGPSYKSLLIVFRVCEKAPFGFDRAHEVWSKLQKANVEITRDLFASYLACLSGQALLDEVKVELPKMKDVTGSDVDFFTIASIFNAAFGVVQQLDIENYCGEKYPVVWRQVLDKGFDEDELGIRQIKDFDRSLMV